MASKGRQSTIDAQWQALQPGWGADDYMGERRMLYDTLDDHENIEGLWGGGYKGLMGRDVMESHDRAIIAATESRLLLMNRGRLSKNIHAISYEEIKDVKENGAGEVRITGSFDLGIGYAACFPSGAPDSFLSLVRSRLLTDTASVEAALSRVLESGESVQFWKRCSGGEETVSESERSIGSGGPGGTPHERWWEVDELDDIVAVATDRRVLLVSDFRSGDYVSVPYANLLTVIQQGARVKFARSGRGEVYVIKTSQSEARQLADLMRSNSTTQSGPRQKRARIFAEWQMHQPIWSHSNTHDKELTRLPELMEDGEQLEGLLGGRFLREESGDTSHDGVVAATDRRLIFLSEGILDKYADHLTYECIGGAVYSKGRVHEEININSTPGNPNYRISGIDGARPGNTRQSGYAEEFAALVRGFLSHSAAPVPNSTPAPGSVTSAAEKISKINSQWRERSPGWELDIRENEREKFYEVLYDDENIELLTEAQYKGDFKGAEEHNVVVALTDRRIVLVYNGIFGEHVNHLSYGDIVRVDFKDAGFFGLPRITLVGRAGVPNYLLEGGWEEAESNRFMDCVRMHLAGSPTAPAAPASVPPAPSAPASVPLAPAESKRARINVQWQERSPDWKLDTRKNEREKLYEVLHDHEDIERLIQGIYRLDQKGAESHDVVVAATDRRLIFVHDGWAGTHLNWMGYHQIESVEFESKLLRGDKMTVNARGGLASYVVDINQDEFGEWMDLFVECVESHLGP